MKKSLLLNTLMVLLTTAIFAQAPQKICYQAAAKDAMGADMISQQISIRASVVKGSPNGLPEWQETHTVVTDGFGLFTIDIGAGTYINGNQTNFANIEWGDGTFWLRIEMDAAGGQNYVLMGTSQMLSVPYSLYANGANRAANADNADNADFATNAGNAQTAGMADSAMVAMTVAGDNDLDDSNEIQTLSYENGELTLLAPDGTPTGDPVAITTSGGGGLDEDPTNELQTLSYDDGQLLLLDPNGESIGDPIQLLPAGSGSGGGSGPGGGGIFDGVTINDPQTLGTQNGELVLLNPDGTASGDGVAFDDSPTNELQTLGYDDGQLLLLDANGMAIGDPIQLLPSGTGGGGGGGGTGGGILDGSNTNEIQTLAIVNDTLVLLNPDGTISPNSGGGIYFPEDNDRDSENELQELSYNNGLLSLSGGNEISIVSNSGFDAPGSSSDFPQGIAGEHILKTSGIFTVPPGKVFYVTAGASTMELTNVGPAPSTIHPTTPNMPIFGEGVAIKDCMCTGMLVDTTSVIEPVILDFITEIQSYQVPAGKVLFIKSGLKNDQPGRLRVNEEDMTFLSPSFTRGTRIMSFPEGTDIEALPNAFDEIDLILTGYLLDRDSVTFNPGD